MLTPVDKIHFWSEIMRDHAEFFLISLSYREAEFIKSAQFYKNVFINVGQDSKKIKNVDSPIVLKQFVDKVTVALLNFISFKKAAITKLLKCEIELNLPPSFINHMINEAMEFYRDLCAINKKAPSNVIEENILLHKIWLPDASGHAAGITAELDPTEMPLIKEAEEFKKCFNNLFIKSVELGQMLERTCLKNGSLCRLNDEVTVKINNFICFLEKIKKLRENCEVLGTINPLIPNHMMREEKYYLFNIESFKKDMCCN